nr:DUF3772 domain-containing protein [Sinorhizobium medicae]
MSLQPRLQVVNQRIDQLKPADEQAARNQTEAIKLEQAQLQSEAAGLQGVVQQADLIALRAQQDIDAIGERRRALFTSSILQRSQSLADPSFWLELPLYRLHPAAIAKPCRSILLARTGRRDPGDARKSVPRRRALVRRPGGAHRPFGRRHSRRCRRLRRLSPFTGPTLAVQAHEPRSFGALPVQARQGDRGSSHHTCQPPDPGNRLLHALSGDVHSEGPSCRSGDGPQTGFFRLDLRILFLRPFNCCARARTAELAARRYYRCGSRAAAPRHRRDGSGQCRRPCPRCLPESYLCALVLCRCGTRPRRHHARHSRHGGAQIRGPRGKRRGYAENEFGLAPAHSGDLGGRGADRRCATRRLCSLWPLCRAADRLHDGGADERGAYAAPGG